jgi:DNA adenine methylase
MPPIQLPRLTGSQGVKRAADPVAAFGQGGGKGVNSSISAKDLKAPFPYFGGKSTVAEMAWNLLGDVDNYVEPFAGSLAILLKRPHAPRVETVNDLDCFIANFWRAIQHDPEQVAAFADWPVNEVDLHARHRWLVKSEAAAKFRAAMRADPEHFDAKIAGWWCWGLCCWIGSGWCESEAEQLPYLASGAGQPSRGVNGAVRRPTLSGGDGSPGHGIHGKEGNRPQLADAYARGRGVNGNDNAGTCAQRRTWLIDWFGRLADRLRPVRVCCGDWKRVCDSPSVTTRLGLTGVFLDPPYRKKLKCGKKNRAATIYANDNSQNVGDLCDEVQAWCLRYGPDPLMRIVLCGLEGEYPEVEAAGWQSIAWKSSGGYANQAGKKNENRHRERLWVSPHCEIGMPLFASVEDAQ